MTMTIIVIMMVIMTVTVIMIMVILLTLFIVASAFVNLRPFKFYCCGFLNLKLRAIGLRIYGRNTILGFNGCAIAVLDIQYKFQLI